MEREREKDATTDALHQEVDEEGERVVEGDLLVPDGHHEEKGAQTVEVGVDGHDGQQHETQTDGVVLEVGVVDQQQAGREEEDAESLRKQGGEEVLVAASTWNTGADRR